VCGEESGENLEELIVDKHTIKEVGHAQRKHVHEIAVLHYSKH
jgi:hypothetical protein